MKYKFLVPIALSIVIGLFFGKVFFDNYKGSSLTVFDEKDDGQSLRRRAFHDVQYGKEQCKGVCKILGRYQIQ